MHNLISLIKIFLLLKITRHKCQILMCKRQHTFLLPDKQHRYISQNLKNLSMSNAFVVVGEIQFSSTYSEQINSTH